MITFKNQPKLSEYDVDKKRNSLRLELVPLIKQFLTTDELFKAKEVSVTFFHEGVSSLVCLVETSSEKYVLKIPLDSTMKEGSEGLFLKTWEAAGVSVPHVFREGKIGMYPYILMQHIDAPIVEDAYRGKDTEQMYLEVGRILRAMHAQKGKGFGWPVNGNGEHKTFTDWLETESMKDREKYVAEHQLLSEEHGSCELAKEILVQHVGESDESSYCHFDYSGGHLFATEPFTVFDPNPMFNNGYIDLGRTLVNYICRIGIFPEQIILGYFGNDEVNTKVLHASIFLNMIIKFPYQHQKGKTEVIKYFQNYLAQNKSLLES